MDPKINGSCWGELPKTYDLNVPFFLDDAYRETERKISIAEEALIAAGRGREHRRSYRRLKKKIDATSLTILFCVGAFVLSFIGWLL